MREMLPGLPLLASESHLKEVKSKAEDWLFRKRHQASLPKSRAWEAGMFHWLLIRSMSYYLFLSLALDTSSSIRCPIRSYLVPPPWPAFFLSLITLSLLSMETLNEWMNEQENLRMKHQLCVFICGINIYSKMQKPKSKSQRAKAGELLPHSAFSLFPCWCALHHFGTFKFSLFLRDI